MAVLDFMVIPIYNNYMDFKPTDMIAFIYPAVPFYMISEAVQFGMRTFIFADDTDVIENLKRLQSAYLNKVHFLQTPIRSKSVMGGVSVSLDDFFENERVDWLFCAKTENFTDILAGGAKLIQKNFENKIFEENEIYVIYRRNAELDKKLPVPIKLRRYDEEGLRLYLDNCQIEEEAGSAVVKLLTRAALDIGIEQSISYVIDAVMSKEISFEEVLEITRRYIWDTNKIYALLTENIKRRQV